ncbi:hypothetical protein [Rhodopseudomonas pseudopalustris]|uniref:hypothetical protein n=1 Tax=Rhodopseudomonas pseudopalustris TaxID=1513892 RepID=UPI001113BA22|nr:hypothetical protein [Rhodopseudomonas pseudopalustris]
MTKTFCWPDGQIEFGEEVPSPSIAIVIATGPEKTLRRFISGVAEHHAVSNKLQATRSKTTPYVPGVLAARLARQPQHVAALALRGWVIRISSAAPEEVSVVTDVDTERWLLPRYVWPAPAVLNSGAAR